MWSMTNDTTTKLPSSGALMLFSTTYNSAREADTKASNVLSSKMHTRLLGRVPKIYLVPRAFYDNYHDAARNYSENYSTLPNSQIVCLMCYWTIDCVQNLCWSIAICSPDLCIYNAETGDYNIVIPISCSSNWRATMRSAGCCWYIIYMTVVMHYLWPLLWDFSLYQLRRAIPYDSNFLNL